MYCTLPQVVLRRRGSPSSFADQPKSQILGHRPATPQQKHIQRNNAYHGNPKLSFLGVITYNPYIGGLKPSFFMVLGSKGKQLQKIFIPHPGCHRGLNEGLGWNPRA